MPTVIETDPEHGEINVSPSSDFVITFNELVDLTAAAVTLQCPTGNFIPLAGLPASAVGSVTVTPTAAMPASTPCYLQVVATQVTDVDVIPNILDGNGDGVAGDNFLLTFRTADALAVSSTIPSNGALGVAPDANVLVTFNQRVDPVGDWYYINCSLSGVHAAAISDADPTFTLNPITDFTYGETCTVTLYAANIHDEDTDDPPDTMPSDYVFDFTVTNCGAPSITLISAIQGTKMPLALEGVYTTEAVVVGDYQQGGFNGFFVQEEDQDSDGNLQSSEGIFVYFPSAPEVQVGDLVRLTGTTSDYDGLTQIGGTITGFEICSTGNPLPAASSIDLPVAYVNDLEWYEGMRVNFVDPLTVVENYALGHYGEIMLAEGGRIPSFTQVNEPNVNLYASFLSTIEKRTILLDDGSSVSNPDPLIAPAPELTVANTLRLGATIASLSGVLDYRYGSYRLQPVGAIDFVHQNLRPPAPEDSPGALTVASANVLNYFNTFSGCTAGIGEDAETGDCRGADDATEFARQRAKIIAELAALDADIVGLMEIENDGYTADSALQDLVDGLNDLLGAGTYAFINPDLANGINAAGLDFIRVALLYKPAAVTPLGDPAVLNSGAFVQVDDITTTGNERRNRVPLAQTFSDQASGGIFTVVVNHLKSKSSSCANPTTYLPTGDPDLQDGQGNCNLTRLAGDRPHRERRPGLPDHWRPELLRAGRPHQRFVNRWLQ